MQVVSERSVRLRSEQTQPTDGANPDTTFAVFVKTINLAIRKAVFLPGFDNGPEGFCLRVVGVQPAQGADPECSPGITEQRSDIVAGQLERIARSADKASDAPGIIHIQAMGSSKPHVSRCVLCDGIDDVVRQSVPGTEVFESEPLPLQFHATADKQENQ